MQSPSAESQQYATPELNQEPNMTFQASHSLPPGYVTFCPVDLDAFEIPKESFYKCSHKYPDLQSTEPSSHKWEQKKGLAACKDTEIFHKLSPCSSKNLNHHIFFHVGFLPKFPPQNIQSKVRGALPLAQGSYQAGSKGGQGQASDGVKFSHLQLPWSHTWEGFTARIWVAAVMKRKGSPICASNDPT